MFRGSVFLMPVVAFLTSCGGSRPPAQPPPAADETPAPQPSAPSPVPVDTGKDCAKATARCGGGACDVTVTNDCDQPVRCAFQLSATCETQSGTVTVNGGDKGLVGPHSKSDLGAETSCPSGAPRQTEVTTLTCK
jgi:hypothetical protein